MKKITVVLWLVLLMMMGTSTAFGQKNPLAEFGEMRIEAARYEARTIKEWYPKLDGYTERLTITARDLEKSLELRDAYVLESANRMLKAQRGSVKSIKDLLHNSLKSLEVEVSSGCKEGAAFPFEKAECERFRKVAEETRQLLAKPEPKVLVDALAKAKRAHPGIFKE